MMVSSALAWLCEEPDHSFTLNMVFRRGWPGLADIFLLPKQFTLGRAARTLERVLFLGGLAAFAVGGGWPALSIALVVGLKAIALIAGLLTPAMVHYGQAERSLQQRQAVLDVAYQLHPERFVRSAPKPPQLPSEVWINKPVQHT